MIAAESIMAAIVPPETRVGLMVLQVVVLSGLLWGCNQSISKAQKVVGLISELKIHCNINFS